MMKAKSGVAIAISRCDLAMCFSDILATPIRYYFIFYI
ncbi:hypothetical protein GAGA_4054 [Paraglaciecola agarilytica NO2]|uniref:Uncharacterized protein n=1 Tax=Paraglaciecola agarilytica NO2 TaxID=1125747 RepID=A0ABQ0ICC6_9ALTE|nr:hypothetical protein GAGA_4054 [Paraglaciecola agarilytica NO2]